MSISRLKRRSNSRRDRAESPVLSWLGIVRYLAFGPLFAGVGAVIAAGFARIFYRNAINLGLPAVVAPEAALVTHFADERCLGSYHGSARLQSG